MVGVFYPTYNISLFGIIKINPPVQQIYRTKNFKHMLMRPEIGCTPIILVHGKLRKEDCEFKASLGYIVKHYLKNMLMKKMKVIFS
jgi:hypothetical protein